MTKEQATKIVERIFARFPKSHLTDSVRDVWVLTFERYEFRLATETIKGTVTGWQGDHPPALNGLRTAIERKHAEAKKTNEPPEIPEATLADSARTPIHRKYLRIIDHIWQDSPSHRYRPGNTGKFTAGNGRLIEARLIEKYGQGWWYEEAWDEVDGGVTPMAKGD